jgi:predicted O-methyltransferase YrrM
MDEPHFAEVDATLMFIEDARERAERAAARLRKDGAEPHLVEALERATEELSATQKTLLQRTHFAAPAAQTSF